MRKREREKGSERKREREQVAEVASTQNDNTSGIIINFQQTKVGLERQVSRQHVRLEPGGEGSRLKVTTTVRDIVNKVG